MSYVPKFRKLLFVLFAGCYTLSILCITKVIPFEHQYQYHYFFYAGSAFLLMYNLSLLMNYYWKTRTEKKLKRKSEWETKGKLRLQPIIKSRLCDLVWDSGEVCLQHALNSYSCGLDDLKPAVPVKCWKNRLGFDWATCEVGLFTFWFKIFFVRKNATTAMKANPRPRYKDVSIIW